MTHPTLAALQRIAIPRERVEVEGHVLYVRGLTGGERAELVRRTLVAQKGEGPPITDLDLLALALCDENGQRLIPDGSTAPLEAIPASVIVRLERAARGLSGLGEDAEKAVEKNSAASQS